MFRKYKSLPDLLEGCRLGQNRAQRQLYETWYSFGLSICLRYASGRQEAEEMLDDGFLKVLDKISYYDESKPFEAWFRTIVTHAAIDYYRKNQAAWRQVDLDEAHDIGTSDPMLEKMTAEEILALVQRLPAMYRTVFSLYVVDGYSHAEIAELLQIQESTSRSNLVKARLKLQQLLVSHPEKQPALCQKTDTTAS
ncbi:RNA polymerase sigma factor [Siphonobacter aquaeclarae]|uniref:RNA polymerase sigma-70 factor, ECF subfamily n=1 Tax=Siphonobacter aquaeclarae TaxID=563176 RepID=A0A1G9K1M1_9BACT|nr:sigma-70 family RNA polymerase sigma factor [Siphonobacter aquaeclarae]MBO9639392.1 sigma-70 family RNA polymerase sigma factor [Siphonobacter aquaeclarae]SDL43083.1 RNA polymerase sigma-70 factor, ECF subfamily [Siphonobacter aquaeclarae]